MSEPILVVHGIFNHDKNAFEQTVHKLSRRLTERQGGEWNLLPVYWADLGGQFSDAIFDILPGYHRGTPPFSAQDVETLLSAEENRFITRDSISSHLAQAEMIAAAASTSLRDEPAFLTRSSGSAVEVEDGVRQAVLEELPLTRYLKGTDDPSILQAVGRAIGQAMTPLEHQDFVGQEVRGLFEDFGTVVKKTVGAVLREMDAAVGAAVTFALGRINTQTRRYTSRYLVETLGDIAAYERNSQKIQNRLRETLANHGFSEFGTQEKPANVVAHSLGGVVAFDVAMRPNDPLYIKTLLTFGSQPAFFNVAVPRGELNLYAHNQSIQLNETIQQWLNLWEPLDFLAFATNPIFRLHDGGTPHDIEVKHLDRYGLYTHSIYWETDELTDAIVGQMG